MLTGHCENCRESRMSGSNGTSLNWDPYNPEYFKNPHPVFARLREEAPLYYNEQYGFYAVSRYADVERYLGDWERFSSARGDVLEMIKANMSVPKGQFIHHDPPAHTVYRKALMRVFSPKRMAALEPQIRAFCARSLDPLVESGQFDFITNLGAEMPMRVISMLLGIPEEDQEAIRERVDANLRTEVGKPIDYSTTHKIGEGFEGYIDWRAEHPSDDLMTDLMVMDVEDETGTTRKFTRDEILVMVNIIAGAGNETTNRLIGWTGKILAENPDQRRQIHENRALIPQAIEEVLRYEPPGPSVARYVTQDVEFHGMKVPAGSAMVGLIAAANRDDRKFADGGKFDINRKKVAHLTFGYGFHNCIGSALARVEGRIALDEILNRFPEWDVDLDNAYLSSTSTVRGWETLPAYTPKAKRSPKAAASATAQAPAAAPEIPGAERWALTMQTPMGPQEMTLHLVREATTLSGMIESPMGSEVIKDGQINGDTLTWVMDVKKPMPIKLKFEAQVQGATLTGSAKLGVFGKAKLEGRRL
jgi:cytochrome P450